MLYSDFEKIFNEIIFEDTKKKLIEKISKYPERYIGLFRPTKPKAKILQNLSQSHEIRFGDAFEALLETYFLEFGCILREKKLKLSDGSKLNLDQCFEYKDKLVFIEQKVRDDHDSTKKRGQIENFEKKLNEMIIRSSEASLIGIFYFIDPDFTKNSKYYRDEIKKMNEDYNVELKLFYGRELFNYFKKDSIWNEILKYLKEWKESLPDLPDTNFDKNAEESFEQIKDLSPTVYRKILQNNELFHEVILTLFPEKKTLNLLLEYFKVKSSERDIYKTLSLSLEEKM